MKVLICSDLHANLEAIECFNSTFAVTDFPKIVCLGDFIGYNPNPEEVMQYILDWDKKGLIAGKVGGNHDQALFDETLLARFNMNARRAITWTYDQLSTRSLEWLKALPERGQLADDVWFCHGSYRDPNEYILDEEMALCNFRDIPKEIRVVFYGHTHLPIIYEMDPEGFMNIFSMDNEGGHQLKKGHRYLINPGSLGQPRNYDARLSFLTYDMEKDFVTFYKREYDYRPTQKKIIAAGLPELLSDRLAEGK